METTMVPLEQIINRLIQTDPQACHHTYLPGQVVFEVDAPAGRFFLIESGEIRVYAGSGSGHQDRLLAILGPGEWFGGAVLAHMPTYGERAVAAQNTRVCILSAQKLRDELFAHPQIAIDLIADMARRLQKAQAEETVLLFDDCRHRLIKTLLRFSRSPAAHRDGAHVVLHLTHAQLAQAVGAARETVSLCLNDLRRQDLLQTGRNQLIFNPDLIRPLADAPTPTACDVKSSI